MMAAYYESLKARQEARLAREGTPHSLNCLEFVTGDGHLHQPGAAGDLHSLPKPGDVVLLPGHGMGGKRFFPGAYLVESIEHIYSRREHKGSRPQEARLTKAVAHVTSLNPALTVGGRTALPSLSPLAAEIAVIEKPGALCSRLVCSAFSAL